MKTARHMTDAEIVAELKDLGDRWDDLRDSDDEGHAGSPGEGMFERMGELEQEQKRRLSKKLPIEKRADRLLQYGVNYYKKWMPIHGYQEPTGKVADWKAEWEKLRAHHLEETKVLLALLEELAKRINNM